MLLKSCLTLNQQAALPALRNALFNFWVDHFKLKHQIHRHYIFVYLFLSFQLLPAMRPPNKQFCREDLYISLVLVRHPLLSDDNEHHPVDHQHHASRTTRLLHKAVPEGAATYL